MSVGLATDGLTVRYGAVAAVSDLTLTVPEGGLVGLIGPNGAGKTTFIDAVTGFAPASGRIVFNGTRADQLSAHRRKRLGIGRTFQSLELFEELTVWENLLVAAEAPRWWSPFTDLVHPQPVSSAVQAAEEALSLVGLERTRSELPAALSLGERKLLTIARALAGRPSMLLLDEPAAGLDAGQSEDLGEVLTGLVAAGMTVLLVDHDMGLVLGICDQIYVLEFGRLIASGSAAEVRADESVVRAYLGEEAAAELRSGAA